MEASYIWYRQYDSVSQSTAQKKRKIERIFQRDGYQCAVPACLDTDLTVDHIVAKWRGGTNDRLNLQTMCRRHNEMKGAMTQEEFQATLGVTW
jgi:5-methylcytosine-specific restriction endonuclease McrA